jgi:hypothetical protein
MHPVRTNAMPDPQDPAVTPAEVAAWLARVRAGRTGVPSPATHWNLWLGLRFLLRLRAERDPDRAWALLVLAVDEHMGRHQRLAEVPLGEVAHDSMMFRVGLLRRLGAVPGDELLDPAVVLDWARAVLAHPLDEMLALAASCRRRMGTTVRGSEAERALVKDLRRLRWIKNRLQVVEALAAAVPVELDPELRAWLAHRDELP